MHSVIVCDEEYGKTAVAISFALAELDSLFEDYVRTIRSISGLGMLEGNKANALKAYAQEAETVRSALAKIAGCHSQIVNSFITGVDDADASLY